MPASENMPISFTFGEEMLEQESEPQGYTFQPSGKRETKCDRRRRFPETRRDRRLLFQEFRAQALQGEIHERYAPLRSSPLRNEIRRADLPDPAAPGTVEAADNPQSDSMEGSTSSATTPGRERRCEYRFGQEACGTYIASTEDVYYPPSLRDLGSTCASAARWRWGRAAATPAVGDRKGGPQCSRPRVAPISTGGYARPRVDVCAEVDDGDNGGGWPTQIHRTEARTVQPALPAVRLISVMSQDWGMCAHLFEV
ncbi:predicted protein [Chaetomium globosum CBS 148.51]|uniref:Uncharacterized protein n=1 Tax=Chaetomium globosum (strain ATCC 6205 / CBS 148.51 / DSM 1962 / NBRC 6347 / NRRL 1970) TaxID=306901 RepID=Q2HF29_CHAGB|nr:uncharacterized protein CHGG_01175 [Chaetomium globosum CBS 148.51]EAQ92940.1 predicted protein [Chaetomium globosum CBS 148.51]